MTTNPTSTLTRAATGTALHLEQVSKIYRMGDTDIIALDQINLTVATGEIVALLGPSGSGKTTLCSIAGGILSATSGRITVGDNDITDLNPKDLTTFRRHNIGFVFQTVNLVPFLTARENLLIVDEMSLRSRATARQRADQLLDELGLADRAGNLPSQLSGGQRQRVAIGRALMNQPKLVLFDEPTSALDTNLGLQVMDLIRTEMKQRGTTAIVVTHDQRATRFADRTVHITDGRLDAENIELHTTR
jgi:putative ABC transport system ATP-binding protein